MNRAAIKGTTKLLGIFGYPVEHTLSPLMHNAALRSMNLDYVYVPFSIPPQELGAAVQAIRSLHVRGFNVTIPHKTSVMKYLDHISPEAQLIGAVNTVVNEHGILTGYNTDGTGYVASLQHQSVGFQPKNKHIVIVGTGGAARAVAVALALAGAAQVTIAGRQLAKAQEISGIINDKVRDGAASSLHSETEKLDRVLGQADAVVNSTPIGMHPHANTMPPIDLHALKKGALVSDLIYNPVKTMLLQEAEKMGFKTVNGIGMLAQQGVKAFEKWTGQTPPVEALYQELHNYFKPSSAAQ